MAEMKSIGVDVVRTNVIFYKVYNQPSQRKRPGGLQPRRPQLGRSTTGRAPTASCSWRAQNGIKVLMTVTGPGPHWSSTRPSKCRRVPCTYLPEPEGLRPVRRGRGQALPGHGRLLRDLERAQPRGVAHPADQARAAAPASSWPGLHYRKLFQAGYKSIARFDGARRNRVLMGETAAISNPLPFLNAALCLDSNGRPFAGRAKRAAGCKAGRLNSGGFAIHPYNFGGYGTPRSKTAQQPCASDRLHAAAAQAVAQRRPARADPGPRARRVHHRVRLPDQAAGPPVADLAGRAGPVHQRVRPPHLRRLGKVKMVGQYELFDVPFADQFNSGLRFATERGGGVKPSYDAYRRSWWSPAGRPARWRCGARCAPAARPPWRSRRRRGGGRFANAATVRTNGRGLLPAHDPAQGVGVALEDHHHTGPGGLLTSRTAKPGKALRYYKR